MFQILAAEPVNSDPGSRPASGKFSGAGKQRRDQTLADFVADVAGCHVDLNSKWLNRPARKQEGFLADLRSVLYCAICKCAIFEDLYDLLLHTKCEVGRIREAPAELTSEQPAVSGEHPAGHRPGKIARTRTALHAAHLRI